MRRYSTKRRITKPTDAPPRAMQGEGMSTDETAGRAQWRLFWAFYLLGMGVFAWLAATHAQFQTEIAPGGILDHQSAGTGMRAEQIHQAWKEKGVWSAVPTAMVLDLVFITLVTIGGVIAGYLMARKGGARGALGWLILGAWLVFAASDYAETGCQLVQVLGDHGRDELAGLAASVKPLKLVAFVIATLALWAGLAWTGMASRKPAPGV